MFRPTSALAPTSPVAIQNISDSAIHSTTHPPITTTPPSHRFIASPLRLQPFALSPVESALPQNQISHFANPIESTPFFRATQFRTNSAPVNPAYTTLTKHPSRNPIRMNTSTKHQGAPPHHQKLTVSYSILYAVIARAAARQQRDCSLHLHALSSSVRRRNSCPSEISPQAFSSPQQHSSRLPHHTPPRKLRQPLNLIPLSTPTCAGAASAPFAA